MLLVDNQLLIKALEVLRNRALQIDIYLHTYLVTIQDCFIWHSGRQKKEDHARGGVRTSLTGLGKSCGGTETRSVQGRHQRKERTAGHNSLPNTG